MCGAPTIRARQTQRPPDVQFKGYRDEDAVATKVTNQAVKRNPDRFPADFMFQLTPGEWEGLRSPTPAPGSAPMRSQTVTASRRNLGALPYAFT